jgi:putative ABC transport system ATP-binding protein
MQGLPYRRIAKVIVIKDMEAGYNTIPKVRIQNLVVEKGTSCLIRGESGSGKTTLLNALSGLIKPIKGQIRIGQADLSTMSDEKLDQWRGEKIGFVFQTLHLVKPLTVMVNILLGAYAAGKPQSKEWAEHLLEETGLKGFGNKRAHEISQGQAQRVAIARALMNKPELILADEPTSSLDNKSTEQIVTLLISLSKEYGPTLIVTSHDNRITASFDQLLELGVIA